VENTFESFSLAKPFKGGRTLQSVQWLSSSQE
jgi:hypothetical protein